ncbi:MAG TPA: (Fe-S)-binding protein, partial [Thermoanaerobaculia bacterium]|nr:(Fe-S)-binding protein [Thermoanaerobaculia bacterium]
PATALRYPADQGSLSRAVLRCVGVGRCRREEGGTMCPSYRVTGEEKHSTRGRARLLYEMLAGEVVTDGFRSEEVREALDLCLACKGCKSDCPAGVDMASYKAEFLHHYYKGRPRPVQAYAVGLVAWWARAGSLAPGLANALLRTRIAKRLGGIAPERRLPSLARETFRAAFGRRNTALEGGEGEPVLLWPDTFTDFFHPEIGMAAADVLEAAGYRVTLPRRRLCCGRPLYDSGMLGLARRWLGRILETLAPEIDAGVPLVVLEPSCAAVFRDELLQLFPEDPRARRLSALSRTLAELLADSPFAPSRLEERAVVHGHCHHKAVMGMAADRTLLARLGLDFEILDSGCCGMAGGFGFEKDHYEVSIACGERVLLPAVRATTPDTLVIADGFSCREQIAQATGRRALHLAQVARMAVG